MTLVEGKDRDPRSRLSKEVNCRASGGQSLLQIDVVRRYPGRFSSVVLVDPDQPDATEALERLVEGGASGLRLRPTARSRGRDPLKIWRDWAIRFGSSSPPEPRSRRDAELSRDAAVVRRHT